MKLAVEFPSIAFRDGPQAVVDLVRAVEAIGFDQIDMYDHVVMGHVRPKVLRTYQPELPLDEARDALTKWAQLLDGILAAGKAAKGAPSA